MVDSNKSTVVTHLVLYDKLSPEKQTVVWSIPSPCNPFLLRDFLITARDPDHKHQFGSLVSHDHCS